MSFLECNSKDVLTAALFYFSQKMQPVLIRAKEKRPFEEGWQIKEYKTEEEIKSAFSKHGGNIGIRGGENGLMIIDCDDARFRDALLLELPMLKDTLQSRGKKETGHFWIKLTKPLKKEAIRLHLSDGTKTTFADLQGIGAQVVVSPSIHPDGMKYCWLNENPILPLDTDVFLTALDAVCLAVGTKNPYRRTETSKNRPLEETNLFRAVKERVRLSDVLPKGERQNCIFHKEVSPSGAMRLYPNTNSVYCFSCGKATDVIGIYAQINKLGQYEAALEMAKRYCPEVIHAQTQTANSSCQNAVARATLAALAKPPVATTLRETNSGSCQAATSCHLPSHYRDGNMWQNGKTEQVKFVPLGEFIPTQPGRLFISPWLAGGTLNVVAAPRASFKSTLTCFMASRLSTGTPFLDFGVAEPIKVAVWDCENGEYHAHSMLNGCVASLPSEDAKKQALQNVSLTVSSDPAQLFSVLTKWDAHTAPNVLILDGLRRFLLDADENDSGDISEFLMALKAEAERLGIAIIFIHHARKSSNNGGTNDFEDKMDSIRGSGDIAAMCASVLLLKRVGESDEAHLQFAKCRWAKEPAARTIKVSHEDEKVDIAVSGFGSREEFENSQRAAEIMSMLRKKGKTEAQRSDLMAMLGLSTRTLDRTLSWMVSQGIADKTGRGQYAFRIGGLFGGGG